MYNIVFYNGLTKNIPNCGPLFGSKYGTKVNKNLNSTFLLKIFFKFTNRTRFFLYKNIVFQKSKIFRQEILEISQRIKEIYPFERVISKNNHVP